ncbi:MAG TPA: hypothetical protein VJA21_00740 [Verrucomicrobiae bacterium]
MPKWSKTIFGLLLLPVCGGAGWALWLVLSELGRAGKSTAWVTMAAGAGCWLAIYLLLPKPMWIYVFGHELTHVLWTWAMGGRVKKFRASPDGGQVVVTKSNFLVALAPYFFPFYAVLVLVAFAGGRAIWGWQGYEPGFHLLLGAAYGFHLTLTWHILKSQQSDITDQGYLFSAVVIFLGNVIVLLVAIPVLTGATPVDQAFSWWAGCTLELLRRAATLVPGLASSR